MWFVVAFLTTAFLTVTLVIKYRLFAFAVYAFAYLAVYLLDGIATVQYGHLFISKSLSMLPFRTDEGSTVLLYIVLAFASYLILYLILSSAFPRLRSPSLYKKRVPNFFAILLPLVFALPVIFMVVSKGQLELLLMLRQRIFDDNLIATIALFLIPAGACLAAVALVESKATWRRLSSLGMLNLYLLLTALTGSRSSLVLNALAPILCFFALRLQARLRRDIGALNAFGLLLLTGILLGCSIVWGSVVYRDATRGNQDSVNFFVSPDVTQFDALSHIYNREFRARTYHSALFFFVPRSVWPNKPNSCNSVLSRRHFEYRYKLTGAEVTCSLLGEAYTNFGPKWGWLVGGFLLAAFALLASRFLTIHSSPLSVMLGLIILFRGLNIIRGDLLNTVLPLSFSALLFWLATILPRREQR